VLGVDGVYMVSVDPDIVWGSLQDATKAGLIMMAGATGTDKGLVHEVSLHGDVEGEMVAAQVVDMTDGDAQIALFTGNEFKTCVNRVTGIKRVLEKCPTCKIVVEIDIPVTSIGQELVSRVESTLQANPDVNVVIAPYDGAANDMVQAIQQAGLQDKVWVASFNGNARNLDFIRNDEVQAVDIGEALAWEGWAGVDNFLRIFNGMGPVDDDGVPARIMVKGNLPPPGHAWEGDCDFRAKYKKIWGLTD
jgi:ribose transport system substrate-binding protein